jgi:hypothetical protein
MKITTMKTLATSLGFLSLALACGLFGTGCSSLGKPASASFASVTITGQSAQQIQDATVAVFREHGYQVFTSGQGLTFEKEGTRANTISRDGLVGAHYGAVTIVRVRAELVELDAGSYRLQCQAFMVSGAGDAFMENEARLANFRNRPYQKLLDEVAKRLKQP